MKKPSLKLKLSLSYVLVALLLVGSISLFLNILFQKQFEAYIIRQQGVKNIEAAARISALYDGINGFDSDALDAAGMRALEEGLILRVSDTTGTVVWDAMTHNHGFCVQMLQSMAEAMHSRYRNFVGAYEETVYPLLWGTDTPVGTVAVGYYGPFYFSENDALFLKALNNALMIIGITALAIALAVGFYMARRISKPITRTVQATKSIAEGNYAVRIHDHSGTRELIELTDAVNSLALRLSEQDQLRRRLTADVAHELRTPLTALQGHIEAFMDGVLPPDEVNLGSCQDEVFRLNRLVGDLERLAHLEDGNAHLEKTAFSLKALVQNVVLGFQATSLQMGIAINILGEDITINADRDKLGQVFVNLITNSLRYTQKGGHINITMIDEGQAVRLLFKDDGEGIAPEHLPYIFERFYRADASRSKSSGGAGIGLAIVHAIICMHGGQISVESTLGEGTVFNIVLPKEAV